VTGRYYTNSVVQTGLMWWGVWRAVVGCGDKCNGSSGFHKTRRITCPVERRSVSQEALCSTELVQKKK